MMFNQAEIRCWSIQKYKQIKRDGIEETQNVQLALDERRKRIGVFTRGEELEQVFFNMEVSKYPIMKFKDLNLYVIFNGQGQGFRLTFNANDKSEFCKVMKKQAYISESPSKTCITGSNSERVAEWTMSRNAFSQPMPSNSTPQKKSAARNLSATSFNEDPFQPVPSTPVTAFSQPVDNYQFSDFSDVDSISSSIGSALSSLSNYTDFSSQGSSSHYSALSPHPFSPPLFDDPEYSTKSVQTEGNLFEMLADDPNFMMRCMGRLMENSDFTELVKLMREQIKEMSDEEREEFFIRTDPDSEFRLTPPVPQVEHFPTSDLEKDPFEDC